MSKKTNQLVLARWLPKTVMMNIRKATFNTTSILSFSRFGELLSKQNINEMRCISAKSIDNPILFKLEKVKGIASI